jgi:hypothetical protein
MSGPSTARLLACHGYALVKCDLAVFKPEVDN